MADLTRICINGDCSDVPSGGGGGGAGLESITYAELVTKKNSGTLTPGGQYRITDYVCTTTQDYSRAVSHPFDIIVFADDESTLNENARACLHEGDNYYSDQDHSANLEAWELKYCIDNDADRFKWVDTVNGKGVIYWMKDERGNECSYDFKQIQFSRYQITDYSDENFVGKYITYWHADYIGATVDEDNPIWCYTFSAYDENAQELVLEDASVLLFTEDTGGLVLHDNVIAPYYAIQDMDEWAGPYVIYLNNNVFVNRLQDMCYNNVIDVNCYENTFFTGCHDNFVGAESYYNYSDGEFEGNKTDVNFSANMFGYSCRDNCFGKDFNSNLMYHDCAFNRFGDTCAGNVIGNSFYGNIIDSGCTGNNFGSSCTGNHLHANVSDSIFETHCNENTIFEACQGNTLEQYCEFNTLGIGCSYNILRDRAKHNTLGNDCAYIDLNRQSTDPAKHYHVLGGTKGTSGSEITINGTTNDFVTYVGKNSNGVLKTWVPADLAP